MKHSFKKIIISLLVFLTILQLSGLPIHFIINVAKAIPVEEVTAPKRLWMQIVQVAEDISNFVETKLKWAWDNWKEILRDTIVKRILDAMVDQTVQWIQGGGEPAFVGDWGSFLDDAFQAGVGDVALGVDRAFQMNLLCSPFAPQIQQAINHPLLPVQKFSQRIKCTLDDIVANIEDFYTNFENGGWGAYNEIWQPQNNFYGTMLMTYDEMMIQGAKRQEAAKNEAMAGKGFLSQKKCVQKDEDAIYECLAAFSPTGNPEDTDASDKEYCASSVPCLKEEIVTPGDTIGQMAADALGSDIAYVVNVKSYVAAIVNAIINRLMSEGLSAMKGSTSGGGTSYSPATTGYGGVVSQELENQKQQLKDGYEKFLKEKQYIYNAKNQSLSYTQQALQALQYIKNSCATCQPPVTNAEINNVQAEIDRLKKEITDLNNFINELKDLIAEINSITPDNRDREMALVFQHQNEFESKYDINQLHVDVFTGDKRSAADNEKTNKQTELTNAQNRLNLCQTTQFC